LEAKSLGAGSVVLGRGPAFGFGKAETDGNLSVILAPELLEGVIALK